MKKLLFILGIFLVIVFVVIQFLPAHSPTFDDCMELGLCAEGLKLKDDGEDFVMTKEYCLEHKYEWLDDVSACNVRKISD